MKIEMSLDAKDLRILALLDRDARESNARIAKRLRLNKDVVNYRVRKMEREGTIKYYYTLINTAALGKLTYGLYLRFRNTSPEREEEIVKEILKDPLLQGVARIVGKYDLGVYTSVGSATEIEASIDALKRKFHSELRIGSLRLFTRVHAFSKGYLLEEKKMFFIDAHSKRASIDVIDASLLGMLAEDGRARAIDLASALGVSARTVCNRMARLEREGVIQGYRAMIDLSSLGKSHYKIDISLATMDHLPVLLEFARSHPDVTYIDETIGGADFEFEVEVSDERSLREILVSVKSLVTVEAADAFALGDHYEKYSFA